MAFNTGAKYDYLEYQEQRSYTGPFVERHTKSCVAIRGAKLKGLNSGVYSSRSGFDEKCSRENIFEFLSESKRKWLIGIKADGTDVCDQFRVLMDSAIPDMVGGDKILA